MSFTLAATALLMGLAGGPHCTAMCGAACAGVSRLGQRSQSSPWVFQAGRVVGYSVAGAIAAEAVQSLAWLTSHAAALQPIWTLFHAAILGWGLMLLFLARQPMWANDAGRGVWSRVRPVAGTRGGLFTAGALWAFMP